MGYEMIDDLTLQNQIRDLALASRSEPTDGWRTEELDPKVIPPFLIELMGRKSNALLLFKNRWTTIY